MLFYETMSKEYKRLDDKIASIQSQIDTLPPGTLVCTHNGKYKKWYHRDENKKLHYISKNNHSLASDLAYKKYLSLQLSHLLLEKKAISSYLKHFKDGTDKASLLLHDNSDYAKLLSTYFHSFSDELTLWANEAYEKNPNYPEQLLHKTHSGHLVRSKSEALIDMMLYLNKIPFRYEPALYLGETTYYPDFMIRHPHNGKTFIWEHFGMMDNPAYAQKAYSKLQVYISHGFFPSANLIITFESKDNPLTSDLVEKMILLYFSK